MNRHFTKEDIHIIKLMKRCSTSYIIRELNIKQVLLHSSRIGKTQNRSHQMLKRMQSNRNFHLLLVRMQNCTANLEGNLAVLTQLNIILPYNPAIMPFSIYANQLKTYVHKEKKNFCMNVYSNFIHNYQNWKQSRCSSILNKQGDP